MPQRTTTDHWRDTPRGGMPIIQQDNTLLSRIRTSLVRKYLADMGMINQMRRNVLTV